MPKGRLLVKTLETLLVSGCFLDCGCAYSPARFINNLLGQIDNISLKWTTHLNINTMGESVYSVCVCVCVRALGYVLLTGNISLRPQRINSFLMCSLKSSSSGDVTRALMSCMHATCNTKSTKAEREKEG